MPEEVVNSETPTPSQEQVVETPAKTTPQETTEAPVTTTPAPAPTVSAVDEFGVPWQNRASEWRRKTEELVDKLPQMLDERLNAFSQQTQRKYTVEELEAFATQTDNPAYSQWARSEIRKLDEEKMAGVIRSEIGKFQKEQTDTVKRQQANQYVAQMYPDAFLKNQAGQIVGWNNQHPLTQQIGLIMQDPRFANDPEGLMAASDIAWARLQRIQQPMAQQKIQQQKEEIKNLQRSTLVEGGTRTNVPSVPEYRSVIDKAKKTGNLRDVAEALNAMAKARKETQEKE